MPNDIKVLKFQDLSEKDQVWYRALPIDCVESAISSGEVRIVALFEGKVEYLLMEKVMATNEPGCLLPYVGQTYEQTALTGWRVPGGVRLRFGPDSIVERNAESL